MLAGAAGGIGAIFRAPLGGALFAGEVLYASTAFESAALLPCLASSIVAYSTFALFITPQPIFILPALSFQGLRDLPLYIGLTLACGLLGWLYVRVFYGLRDKLFRPMPIPKQLKPAVGGLLLGLVAQAAPQVMTGGYSWVQWGAIGMPPALTLGGEPSFVPQMGAGLLLLLAILKIVATSLTISSGGSGGVFGPSVLIGGMLGGAYGQLVSSLLPGARLNPAAFALVGMGGFFAGVSKTPLTWVHPCTGCPVAVVKLPSSSVWKFPARVYSVEPSGPWIRKKPSPWIAASREPPVVCTAPCVNWRNVVGVPTPNPTCVSPRPAPRDWVTRSWKETSLFLNPTVFRFARLLPTTSMAVEQAASAERAVENDVNIKSP
jgi:hypothetical protein